MRIVASTRRNKRVVEVGPNISPELQIDIVAGAQLSDQELELLRLRLVMEAHLITTRWGL